MSKTKEIRVPDIGDFDKVPVIEILVSEGDSVEAEDSLVTLESDKATMEVPSPEAGKVVSIKVSEGDEVSEGDVIAEIEIGEDSGDDEAADQDEDESQSESEEVKDKDKEKEKETASPEPEARGAGDEADDDESEAADESRESKAADADDKKKTPDSEQPDSELPPPPVPYDEAGMDPSKLPHASPSVRKLARELGVALDRVKGSGRKGRITGDDLKDHIKQAMKSGPGAAAGAPGLAVAPPPKVDFSKFGEIREEKLSRIKLKSGPALHRNWVSIPHVTQFDEADITEMEAFRKAEGEKAKQQGVKLTPLVFIMKAVVTALKAFPHFNASLSGDGQSLIYKNYFHVGVAVDTPNGLVVPVIRDCDQKGLMEMSSELAEISGKARDGKLSPGDMQGGCFSISSLGGIGGTAFTPIINAPEVAILGVSRSETKPVWNGSEFEPRLMLPLSLSYDHRVIDGADAARFTRHLAGSLEDLRRLLL